MSAAVEPIRVLGNVNCDIRQALNKKVKREREAFTKRVLQRMAVVGLDYRTPALDAEDDRLDRERYRVLVMAFMEFDYEPQEMGPYIEGQAANWYKFWQEEFPS